MSFWFGTQFKAMYLPWVLFAFNMIIKGLFGFNYEFEKITRTTASFTSKASKITLELTLVVFSQ